MSGKKRKIKQNHKENNITTQRQNAYIDRTQFRTQTHRIASIALALSFQTFDTDSSAQNNYKHAHRVQI